jgi:hypothetical protein
MRSVTFQNETVAVNNSELLTKAALNQRSLCSPWGAFAAWDKEGRVAAGFVFGMGPVVTGWFGIGF